MGLGTMLLWIGAVAGAEAQAEPQGNTLALSPAAGVPVEVTCWINEGEKLRPIRVDWARGSAEPKRIAIRSSQVTVTCDAPVGIEERVRDETQQELIFTWDTPSVTVEPKTDVALELTTIVRSKKTSKESSRATTKVHARIEEKPSIADARTWLQSPTQPGGMNRSLSSPVPPLVTDTLDIVTEIVLSRAKAGAFDVVQDQMEHWLCEDATLPTGAVVPAALMPLVGKPLLPETCRVVRGLTLPALANSAEALTSALQEDAMSAALDLARPGMTAVGYGLPFSPEFHQQLRTAAQEFAARSNELAGLPQGIQDIAKASASLLTDGSQASTENSLRVIRTTTENIAKQISKVADPVARCRIKNAPPVGQTTPPGCKDLSDQDEARLTKNMARWELLQNTRDKLMSYSTTGGTDPHTLEVIPLSSRITMSYVAWLYVGLLMEEAGARIALSSAIDDPTNLAPEAALPGQHLSQALTRLEPEWLTQAGQAKWTKIADDIHDVLTPALAAAASTGDWKPVISIMSSKSHPSIASDDHEWNCAWAVVSSASTPATRDGLDAKLAAGTTSLISVCDIPNGSHPNLDSLIRLAGTLSRDSERAEARLDAALKLLAWSVSHQLESQLTEWVDPAFQPDARAIAHAIRISIGSGALVEGTPLHEMLDRMAPTLREIARNPRGFDVEDARALVGQVATVDWVETYGASSATCAAELSMAVAGLCMRDGGCDGAMVAQRLAKPSAYLNLAGECSAILPTTLRTWPELPNLVTNATRVLAPSRSSDATEQARASLDLAFGLADLFVQERGGAQTEQAKTFLSQLRRMALALVDQDLATVATTAAELLESVLEQAQHSGPPSHALDLAIRQLNHAMPVITTLAANARNLEQAAANPADAEALRRARKAALEDLIEASTNRENRQGDGIVSLGVPVGALLPLWAYRGGEDRNSSPSEAWVLKTRADFPDNLSLSIPLSLAAQQLPWGDRPHVRDAVPGSFPEGSSNFGFMGSFSPIDLGQFLSTDTDNGDGLTWGDIIVLDVQGGILFTVSKRSASPFFVGIDGRVRPGGDAAGAWSIGLTASYYVPLFDIN